MPSVWRESTSIKIDSHMLSAIDAPDFSKGILSVSVDMDSPRILIPIREYAALSIGCRATSDAVLSIADFLVVSVR